MGVGRNSRRESLAESEERRKGESRESRFEHVRVRAEGPANEEFLDTKSGDWNQNWRPTRVELADIDLDNGRLLLRRRIR